MTSKWIKLTASTTKSVFSEEVFNLVVANLFTLIWGKNTAKFFITKNCASLCVLAGMWFYTDGLGLTLQQNRWASTVPYQSKVHGNIVISSPSSHPPIHVIKILGNMRTISCEC